MPDVDCLERRLQRALGRSCYKKGKRSGRWRRVAEWSSQYIFAFTATTKEKHNISLNEEHWNPLLQTRVSLAPVSPAKHCAPLVPAGPASSKTPRVPLFPATSIKQRQVSRRMAYMQFLALFIGNLLTCEWQEALRRQTLAVHSRVRNTSGSRSSNWTLQKQSKHGYSSTIRKSLTQVIVAHPSTLPLDDERYRKSDRRELQKIQCLPAFPSFLWYHWHQRSGRSVTRILTTVTPARNINWWMRSSQMNECNGCHMIIWQPRASSKRRTITTLRARRKHQTLNSLESSGPLFSPGLPWYPQLVWCRWFQACRACQQNLWRKKTQP